MKKDRKLLSHDLQEKSINFQALNQLIQELEQQKPEIQDTIRALWLNVYEFNHILGGLNEGIGARISIRYIDNDVSIRNLIAFCNQYQFVRRETNSFNIGDGFKQIINFKLDNFKQSIVLLDELKSEVNEDYSYQVEKEEERLQAENCNHLTAKEYVAINSKLRDALNGV